MSDTRVSTCIIILDDMRDCKLFFEEEEVFRKEDTPWKPADMI
ncbi:hypothetical protein MITSMUL_04753 [Mitsuokella multacida DSM 20544]|uniref:Uncharacterized protein n=1 Tax=Mitsuokella multacida DSM 20544 TaxID=500635 RepID=C9KMU8_9FIRM|nr:hypothetical protein MITSMUL_04753 [Mitsuokella multacida DSM 20544]